MLYDCWRDIVVGRPRELAIWECPAGRRWTFAELSDAAERSQSGPGRIVFPKGSSVDFIVMVLEAWRTGRVVCPLEHDQARPNCTEEGLPEGTVHLKTTSASTGAPRLVVFKSEQLAADAHNIVLTMGLRPDWPNLGLISLAHSYGFSNLVLPLLLHGIPLYLPGAPLPETLRCAAASLPALTLAAVPALWQAWHEAGAISENVKLAISAGAPLPLGLEQRIFERCALKVHNFYGSSECGGIAYDDGPAPRTDAHYVGRPLKNVHVGLAEDGCLEVRSEAVAETYWPEPNRRLGRGIFLTTDLGEVTGGRVFLRGRAGDQINVAGRKVLPETIESVLSTHPEVHACLAFGIPSSDPQRGDTIVACVAGAPTLARDSLKQFALGKLPAWQVPREWWFVEGLEANGRGKVSRAAWRQRYLEKNTP